MTESTAHAHNALNDNKSQSDLVRSGIAGQRCYLAVADPEIWNGGKGKGGVLGGGIFLKFLCKNSAFS